MWLRAPKVKTKPPALNLAKSSLKTFYQTYSRGGKPVLSSSACLLHLFALTFNLNWAFFWEHTWLLYSHTRSNSFFWIGFCKITIKLNSSTCTNTVWTSSLKRKNIKGIKADTDFVYQMQLWCIFIFVMTLLFVVFGCGLPLSGNTLASKQKHTKYQFLATV